MRPSVSFDDLEAEHAGHELDASAPASRTSIVTLCRPRIAASARRRPRVHGVRVIAVVRDQLEVRARTDRAKASDSSPKRGAILGDARCRARRGASRQASSDAGRHRERRRADLPGALVPTGTPQPLYGNVVQIVPGVPRSLP